MHKSKTTPLTYQNKLKSRIVIEHDGDHAQVAQRASGSSKDVFTLQPQLTWSIQATIVHAVVIAFR